jgi:hypothetical protein
VVDTLGTLPGCARATRLREQDKQRLLVTMYHSRNPSHTPRPGHATSGPSTSPHSLTTHFPTISPLIHLRQRLSSAPSRARKDAMERLGRRVC